MNKLLSQEKYLCVPLKSVCLFSLSSHENEDSLLFSLFGLKASVSEDLPIVILFPFVLKAYLLVLFQFLFFF